MQGCTCATAAAAPVVKHRALLRDECGAMQRAHATHKTHAGARTWVRNSASVMRHICSAHMKAPRGYSGTATTFSRGFFLRKRLAARAARAGGGDGCEVVGRQLVLCVVLEGGRCAARACAGHDSRTPACHPDRHGRAGLYLALLDCWCGGIGVCCVGAHRHQPPLHFAWHTNCHTHPHHYATACC